MSFKVYITDLLKCKKEVSSPKSILVNIGDNATFQSEVTCPSNEGLVLRPITLLRC